MSAPLTPEKREEIRQRAEPRLRLTLRSDEILALLARVETLETAAANYRS